MTTGEAKRQDWETCTMLAHTLRGEGFDASEDGTGRGTPLVPVHRDIAPTLTSNYGKQPDSSDTSAGPMLLPVAAREFSCAGCGKTISEAWGWGEWCDYCGHEHAQPVAFDTTQITSAANYSNPKPGDPCHPLAAGAHPPAIAFGAKDFGGDATAELSGTLRCGGKDGGANWMAVAFPATLSNSGVDIELSPTLGAHNNGTNNPATHTPGMAVRRLTPRECERLQGFPDDYTAIPWRNKPASECPDGPRYKALGNSWAVPCAAWIGRRIDQQIRSIKA